MVIQRLSQINSMKWVFSTKHSSMLLQTQHSACALEGVAQLRAFEPDTIIAIGGGSAMDAGKIMWVLYEHPDADFFDMAMRYIDIRKRVYTFPKMGEKAYFIAIPTSSGTGSAVTPFAVITDEKDRY